ncbi:nuclear transport factor 2 family protein [Bradyrhizobium sp. 138]|uniref:nuclear transport factor 2 family protein n=1 Tax=Bradyrhizobium sp. 138 TaxID=2782615 RepID=UPI001FF7FA69|nr:nuclear transport factor 2 family protein [Bradyrhizobium sp. 138]MCK1734900.1 nuclear transport factor 2 family protein [Bradyrhizobium sp. 138]
MPAGERIVSSPKDIVLNAWKTFSSRDAMRIAALFTDDAEWIAPKGNATAVALDHTDHMRGSHDIARFIAHEMHKMFANIDIAFRGVYADGDVVIVEERMRATLPGGKPYENDYCFVFTVAGDRIRQVREYMDTRKGWRMVFGEEG